MNYNQLRIFFFHFSFLSKIKLIYCIIIIKIFQPQIPSFKNRWKIIEKTGGDSKVIRIWVSAWRQILCWRTEVGNQNKISKKEGEAEFFANKRKSKTELHCWKLWIKCKSKEFIKEVLFSYPANKYFMINPSNFFSAHKIFENLIELSFFFFFKMNFYRSLLWTKERNLNCYRMSGVQTLNTLSVKFDL